MERREKLTFIGVEPKSIEQVYIWINGPLNNGTLTTLHTAFSSSSQFLPGTTMSTAYSSSFPFFSFLPLSDETLLEVLIQKGTKEPELFSSIVSFWRGHSQNCCFGIPTLLDQFLSPALVRLVPLSFVTNNMKSAWYTNLCILQFCNSCFASDVSPMSP